MKANAPEKLYLISDKDGVMLSYDPFTKLHGDRYDFVDKEVFPIEEGCEVEYVRTDSFVEKAAEWLNNFYNEDTRSYLIDEDIEKFINYMKGL